MKGLWRCLAAALCALAPLGCGGGAEVKIEGPPMSQEERQSRDMIQQLMEQRNQANPYATGQRAPEP